MPSKRSEFIAAQNIALPQRISFRVQRLNSILTTQAIKILKETAGLTLNDWRLLTFLDERGTASVADLVKISEIDKATMSRCSKNLLTRGLISSEVDSGDSRRTRLSLTPKGQEAVNKAKPHMQQRQLDLMECFTDEEFDLFYALIDKLEQKAKTKPGVRA